jgi:hypothetical protein
VPVFVGESAGFYPTILRYSLFPWDVYTFGALPCISEESAADTCIEICAKVPFEIYFNGCVKVYIKVYFYGFP